MIFVTVGSQMPFNRMLNIVESWAKIYSHESIIAQVGITSEKFKYLECYESFPPSDYQKKIEQAEIIIGHAGMGTILTSLEAGKPLLIMAREGKRHETRNDHQIATKNWVKSWPNIFEFNSIETLEAAYQSAISSDSLSVRNQYSESCLVDFLSEIINS